MVTGIEYTLGRIPMASCDFSTHPYSYDDNEGDFNLTKFSLTLEDKKYKVIVDLLHCIKKSIHPFNLPNTGVPLLNEPVIDGTLLFIPLYNHQTRQI